MTKEEILKKFFVSKMKNNNFDLFKRDYPSLLNDVILPSMQDYSYQQNKELQEQIDELLQFLDLIQSHYILKTPYNQQAKELIKKYKG